MAIDFSQVKSLTIPQGQVKQIEINGVVVWKETPSRVLSSITLSGETTSLPRDSDFSFGGVVTANYSDGTTEDVTSSTTFSGYNMSTKGTYTVTASYTEGGVTVTATYQLTITSKWVQVWSGTKTVKYDSGTISGSSSNFTSTPAGTGTTPQIRITFSMSNSGIPSGYSMKYYKNSASTTTSKPGSPQTFTVANNRLLGIEASGSFYKRVYLNKANDSTNNCIKFSLAGQKSSDGSFAGIIQLTITKIEIYY